MTDRPRRKQALEFGLTIDIDRVCPEETLIEEMLDLDGKEILELGCGRAQKTRLLAEGGRGRRILALEVDEIQHALNLEIDDLPNVRFALGGAEKIPAPDHSFDLVFLFKSFHHVPVESMDRALTEIARVLREGGLAYISEPLVRGDFSELLRLFHDERRVRQEAFTAIERSLGAGTLELVSQTFFRSPLHIADYAEFERLFIHSTHTRIELTAEAEARVRSRFESLKTGDGADFEQPLRVDLLRKPATPHRFAR